MTPTAKLLILLTAVSISLVIPTPPAGAELAEDDPATPPPAVPVPGVQLVGLNFATLEAQAIAEAEAIAEAAAAHAEAERVAAAIVEEAARRQIAQPIAGGTLSHLAATASPASLQPCGGDYPPCSVAARESGGRYDAVNSGGCGGAGCYGKWQFGGFWAGKLGLPVDIWNATPEQQDEAARILWNGGAGCGNWSACG